MYVAKGILNIFPVCDITEMQKMLIYDRWFDQIIDWYISTQLSAHFHFACHIIVIVQDFSNVYNFLIVTYHLVTKQFILKICK